jgi:putative membrane protein
MNRNHNMKRNIERLAAGALAAAVGFGTVACGAAGTSSKSSSKDTLKATKEKLEDTMEVSTSFGDKADEDAEKIETVYVSADADGSAKDVTVSNWLRNYSGKDKIDDKSDLTDIKNVKGNQKFEKGSDGALTWNADGKDVFYQGKTKDSLPVGVKVSYKLDGQDIDAKDLAGKSGKVTIRFDYTNTAKTTVNVDGQDKEMTVPFAMISGMVLPSDHFSNITVTNGKVVSDADNNIVMGVALPGLSDALSIDRSKLDDLGVDAETTIPDYVEITADAKDFELGLTMTMASANVLSDLGFSDYDNSDAVNKIGDDMDKLQSSMQQLIDGGQKVSDGTKTLKEGSAALKDGVNAYTGGVSQLTAGAKKLNDSISTLTDGTQKLSDGVKLLKQKLSQAKSSKDVKDIQNLYQSYQNIYNTLNNPNGAYKQAEVSVGKLSDTQTKLTDLQNSVKDVSADTLNQKLLEAGMTKANDTVTASEKDADAYNTILNTVKAGIKKQYHSMSDTDIASNAELITKAAIKNAIDDNMDFNPDTFSTNIQTYVNTASSTLSGIQTNATAAKGITKEVAAKEQPTRGYENIKSASDLSTTDQAWLAATGMTQKEWDYLSTWSRVTDDANANTGAEYLVKYNAFMIKFAMIQSAYNSVQSKLSELSNGVDQLDAGTSQLLNGISQQLAPGVLQLYNGAAKLNSNSAALNKGASELYEGAGQLADGSATLSDGLVQFNDEGIAKLSEAFTGEVSQFADQLKAVDDAGKSYTTFSGKADDMNSSVKFIIETDEISKDSKN